MKIKVSYDAYRDTVREPYSDDSWDRGDTSTDYDVANYVYANIPDDMCGYEECIAVSDDIEYEDNNGFLIYAVYSTGDSFGYDYNGGIEFIDMYKTLNEADKVKRQLENDQFNILSSSGKSYNYYAPWTGYFESLSYIEVLPVRIIRS